jgi:Ca2+-transporting ATPase
MAIQSVNAAFEPVPGENALLAHALPAEQCLIQMGTSLQGLSSEEAQRRLEALGTSAPGDFAFQRAKPRQVFMCALNTQLAWLFLAGACTSLFIGRYIEGLLIILAFLGNGIIHGLIQWRSLQNQTQDLNIEKLRCLVRRDGQSQLVNATELVPGDILLIESGQVIPADARLVSGYQLQVDESLLTGESVLVPKNSGAILHAAEEVSAQCNMLFAGTVVKTGKGEAVVTALGPETAMGKIAALARGTAKRESRFTRQLNTLSMQIFVLALLLCAGLLGLGYWQKIPTPLLIQACLMILIAAFPKTIPTLAGFIVSMGIHRLNQKKVLVKNFHAIESLGDVTVVCSDKTGTLTENYLTLEQMFLPGLGAVPYDPRWQTGEQIPYASVQELLRIGRLNNGTVLEGLRSPLMGDPIDIALYRAAPAALEAGYHQRLNIPFDPVKLRSATVCETPDGRMVSMIKGAPEAVMESCRYYMKPDGTTAEITLTQRSEFLMYNRKLAYENNLRVIGFAQKLMLDDNPYENAVFVGWICLLDPPRPGVIETIQQLQTSGAEMIMITGDQKATAEITAWELGIMRRKSDEVWLRSDLENWEEPNIPGNVRVFARTKPEEKLAIVESLQRSGQVVAMVGDGVNDSPALQKSDVAIAMGLQGAEAAKDSADIILLNDRLDGLIQAMKESIALRFKIRSCMSYITSCNLSIILFVAIALAAGLGLPVSMGQMLWLNLVVVSVPALVLAIEPVRETAEAVPTSPENNQADKWRYRPQTDKHNHQAESVEDASPDAEQTILMFYWAALMAGAGFGAYYLCGFLKLPVEVASTAAFCALAVAQTCNMFNVQAVNAGQDRKTFLAELSSTPVTWLVIALTLLLQAIILYTPGLNQFMGLVALPASAVSIALACGGGAILFSLKTMKF